MNVSFIKKYFTPGSILDIGAHSGEFYKECLKHFPFAGYFLVEGNTECEPVLKELNVPYFIGLLGDREGYTNFYKSKLFTGCTSSTTGNSIYREKTSYYNKENTLVSVEPIFKLDDITDRIFDLIKLDVQGAELDILRGGQRTAKLSKGIILEVSLTEYNENAPLEEQIMKFMTELGFVAMEMVDTHRNPETQEHIQNDVFFLREDLV
jgi:FkbM family methyltransferase